MTGNAGVSDCVDIFPYSQYINILATLLALALVALIFFTEELNVDNHAAPGWPAAS